MRRLITLVVVAIVASSCAQTVNVDQEKAALMTADAEWAKVAKDIDKFVAYFTPDATMSMAGMPAMTGPKAIKDNMGPMMKAPGFDITWKATRADVAASGDLGYTVGTYAITMNNPAGSPMTEKGKYRDAVEEDRRRVESDRRHRRSGRADADPLSARRSCPQPP